MEVIIRVMEEKHLDRIMEVEKASFTTPWSRKSLLFEISQNRLGRYFIAEVDGRPVAYGGIWLIVDEGHITNIAVDKDYRGLGIGGKILEALIDICKTKEIASMTLEVRANNEPAKMLYKKYGFVEHGIRPNYYVDDNQDAIIMWKNLKD